MMDVVTYRFRVLPSSASGETALRAEVANALATTRSWEQLVELRMGAGPVVRIDEIDVHHDAYEVSVTWGDAQFARSRVRGQEAAIEAADRLALALYQIRASSRVVD